MYSYTATGINSIYPADPSEPKIRIRCKCHRDLIQEQIYTCISCTNYSCHFCTIPDIIYFQCRNCKMIATDQHRNKCRMCFSCPYCSNILVVSRLPNKKFIMLCNFCGWNTQQIQLSAQKGEQLIEALNKFSTNMKEHEYKVYNATQGLFKEVTALIQHDNQTWKYTHTKKNLKKTQQDSLQDSKNQFSKTCETLISRMGLDDESEEYNGDIKMPQNLPLLAKKTRRCPNCKKPLTTTFQTKTGEQKTELMYKDLKIIQCQRKPAVQGQVKIKCLRNLLLNGETQCKAQEIKDIAVNQIFKVKIQIVNRTRQTTNEIQYDFVILTQ